MEAMLRAALLVLSVLPEVERVWGQRAPCYECEVYKDAHPQSRPYEEVSNVSDRTARTLANARHGSPRVQ